MLPPPESILPLAPRLKGRAKSALVALLITVVLSALGVGFSFFLAHTDSFGVRTITTLVFGLRFCSSWRLVIPVFQASYFTCWRSARSSFMYGRL